MVVDSESDSGTEASDSLGHLVAVWALFGLSLWPLGTTLAEVLPVTLSLSGLGTGLLFGTVVVASLWVAGVRPSIRASAGYFVTELAVRLSLLFGVALFLETFPPALELGYRLVPIGVATLLVFTAVGERLRECVRRRFRAVLKVPTAEDMPDGR
jgi:hypothetical protein